MITIVLTYRNRDLRIVRNCLASLENQSIKSFNVILVDYGSEKNYADALETLVSDFDCAKLITCPVIGQLWNKCRAINIALKQTTSPYFLVGDIDLIFHPDFIKIANKKATDKVLYFKYGFLSEKESLLEKKFEDYQVYIQGNDEITGTTLFPTDKLLEVNGYDEFYHGWGAEDTDIHIRLKEVGLDIEFYNNEILIKHQWHPKAYRSKQSTSPYHSNLEKINHSYMNMTQAYKRVKVNSDLEWGKLPLKNEYDKLLNTPDHIIEIKPIDSEFSSLLAQFKNFKNELVKIEIQVVTDLEKQKQNLKRFLNKKYLKYLDMEKVNNFLLEEIIKNYRNHPYIYNFDRNKGYINFLILF